MLQSMESQRAGQDRATEERQSGKGGVTCRDQGDAAKKQQCSPGPGSTSSDTQNSIFKLFKNGKWK